MKKKTRMAFAALLRSFADLTEAGHCNLSEEQVTALVNQIVASKGAPECPDDDHETLLHVEAGLLELRQEVRALRSAGDEKKDITLIPKI